MQTTFFFYNKPMCEKYIFFTEQSKVSVAPLTRNFAQYQVSVFKLAEAGMNTSHNILDMEYVFVEMKFKMKVYW